MIHYLAGKFYLLDLSFLLIIPTKKRHNGWSQNFVCTVLPGKHPHLTAILYTVTADSITWYSLIGSLWWKFSWLATSSVTISSCVCRRICKVLLTHQQHNQRHRCFTDTWICSLLFVYVRYWYMYLCNSLRLLHKSTITMDCNTTDFDQ